jgi:hypothetical protein
MTTQEPTQADNPLRTALEASALISPVVIEHGARRVMIYPASHKLTELTLPHVVPPHVVQDVQLDDADSLIAYCNRYGDLRSLLVADIDRAQISAQMDWHAAGPQGATPMPCAHTATLQLRPSEEYTRWNKCEGTMHQQAEFAAFLEENASDIIDPDPAVMIEMIRSPGTDQWCILRTVEMLSTPELVRVSLISTRPLSSTMPTQ